jgi:hypothetical protein
MRATFTALACCAISLPLVAGLTLTALNVLEWS